MVVYNRLTLKDVLVTSRVQFPDRPALSFVGEKPITYSEMSVIVRNISSLLITLGVEKGDRVALLGENSPNWGIAYFAITCMGGVVVPILPDFTHHDVKKIIDHSQAKVVFVSTKQFAKIGNEAKIGSPDIILLNTLDVVEPNTLAPDISMGYRTPEALVNIEYTGLEIPKPMEEDLAAIIYTSGTTGRPKGVMLSHKNIISNSLSTFQIQSITSTDRLLSILPLSHTYECTIGFVMPIMRGASVYYLQKPATASVLLPAMQEVKPTMMLVVPLIIEKVFRGKVLPELTASKFKAKLYGHSFPRKLMHRIAAKKLHKAFGGELHFFGIGGSKLSSDTERFLFEGKFPYSIGYGLTETSPLLTGSSPDTVKYRCAGISLPGQEMIIANPNPETGEGEVWARGANVMIGYYKEPELTKEVLTDDGWFKTGDLGYVHKDGFLELRGRLKNMIVGPSGENIYPEDIEDMINSHSLVLESLVYEIGGRLEAKVRLNYELLEAKYADFKIAAKQMHSSIGDSINEIMDEIKQNVNTRVAAFSRLSVVVEQIEPFEKTPTHKIKRFIYASSNIA
ncbi:MAG: AMP-binding protein [Tenuifilaceae bacterium]|nr:AMP-binding protein [Tenuifilaceae bacterium]